MWHGAFIGWTQNWVTKNFWRVQHTLLDRDDAIQECAFVFAKCKARYEGSVDNPAHFMRLYTISVVNHWNTLSKKDGEARAALLEHYEIVQAEDVMYKAHDAARVGEGAWYVGLSELSEEALAVISAIVEAPDHVIRFIFGGAPQRSVVHNRRMMRAFDLHTLKADVYTEICNILGKKPLG